MWNYLEWIIISHLSESLTLQTANPPEASVPGSRPAEICFHLINISVQTETKGAETVGGFLLFLFG